jgi:ABC-type Fe3+ transport system substrate-binding protein
MSRVPGRYALVSAVAISVCLLAACDGKSSGESAAMTEMAAFMKQSMPTTPPDLLKAACDEGKLDILYNNVKNLSQYTDAFKKHFPCLEVSAVANGDDDNLAKFLAADKQGVPPDLIQLGSMITLHTQLAQKGMLLKYEATEGAKFVSMDPGLLYSTDHQSQGILYNTNSIKESDLEPIKTWKDLTVLLDPKFDGKRLGVVDPHGAGGGSYVVAYVLYKEIGQDNVKKLLDKLQVTVYAGSGPAVDALSSGEIDLVLGNEFNAFSANQKGAPVQVWYPEPRSASYTGIGIAAKAKHPNAAKLFLEYVMSDYGNAQIPTLFSMAPGREGTADSRPSTKAAWYKPQQEAYKFDVDDMLKSYDAVVAPFPAK